MSETRKVQLTGGSTFTISLPKQWAREHGLEAGARLHLYPQDNATLVVRAERVGGADQETEFSAVGLDPADIERAVRALYSVGFDSFRVTVPGTFDTEQRNAVSDAVGELIGLEALTETENAIGCECLLNTPDISLRQTLIQLQLVAVSMHRTALAALSGEEIAGEVRQRDDEADRLFSLVDRYYQRSLGDLQDVSGLGLGRPQIADYRAVARQLERVADHAETIAEVVDRMGTLPEAAPVDRVQALAETARRLVEDATSAVLGGPDADAAYRVLRRRDELHADVDELDRRLYDLGGDAAYALGTVLDSVRRTADYGANVAEVALRAAARDGTL